jgi:hypothetical protein
MMASAPQAGYASYQSHDGKAAAAPSSVQPPAYTPQAMQYPMPTGQHAATPNSPLLQTQSIVVKNIDLSTIVRPGEQVKW